MVNLVALHGFWGTPSDFDALFRRLGAVAAFTPDLYDVSPLDPTHDLATWTDFFCNEVERRFNGEKVTLLGYSMGGRLALHALSRRPDLFENAVLLSTNPGWLTDEERAARATWIRDWCERFLRLDWEDLEREWNRQETFVGSHQPARRRPDRRLLALSLENWSLLAHRFPFEDLLKRTIPVHWMFGALDHKFLAVKARLQGQNVAGEFHVIENAGHRLPQDAPEALARLLAQQGRDVECRLNL